MAPNVGHVSHLDTKNAKMKNYRVTDLIGEGSFGKVRQCDGCVVLLLQVCTKVSPMLHLAELCRRALASHRVQAA